MRSKTDLLVLLPYLCYVKCYHIDWAHPALHHQGSLDSICPAKTKAMDAQRCKTINTQSGVLVVHPEKK